MITKKDKIILDSIYDLPGLVEEIVSLSEAYHQIGKRNKDAHDYCQKYIMPEAWGKNVWGAILDDAIRMRKAEEKNK